MDSKIKVDKDSVCVTVRLAPWKPGLPKRRFYEDDARRLVLEKHPKLKLGKCVKPAVAKNQGPNLEGEWVFLLVQDEKPVEQKKSTPPKPKKKVSKKKEVESVKSEDNLTTGGGGEAG